MKPNSLEDYLLALAVAAIIVGALTAFAVWGPHP